MFWAQPCLRVWSRKSWRQAETCWPRMLMLGLKPSRKRSKKNRKRKKGVSLSFIVSSRFQWRFSDTLYLMHVTVDFKLWRSCFVHLSKFLFPCPTSRLGKMKVWGVEKVVKFGGGPCRELCESTFNCIECRVYFVLITFFFPAWHCALYVLAEIFSRQVWFQEWFGGEQHDIWCMIPNL